MKKQILAAFVTVLLSSSAFAQSEMSTSIRRSESSGISSQGFRVTLLKPVLAAAVTAKIGGASFTETSDIKTTLGAALGYASFPVRALGWSVNAGYLGLDSEGGGSIGLARIDGNLGYAFGETMSVKGGLNVSKFTGNSLLNELDAGFGGQFGLGIQANRTVGFDIGLVWMNQAKKAGDAAVEVAEAGLEFAINATF